MHGLMMNYPLTVDRILEHGRHIYPGKSIVTRLSDGALHRYSYTDLYSRAKKLAKALVKLGVRPGDRVATFSWNNYQHLELYYAIPGAAAVCHTINISLFAEDLIYTINHAQDRVVFIDASLLSVYEPIASRLDCVEHYVIFNGTKDLATSLPGALLYEDLLATSDEDFEWLPKDENLAAGLCYTSGTTGHPKGVLYSHRSTYLHAVSANQANTLGLRETDIVMPLVPQFHVMAWGLPYAAIMAGAGLVMPGPHLQPEALVELIEGERTTVVAAVPTIWNGIYEETKARPRDLSSIRTLLVGGAAMPRSLIKAFEHELGVEVLHAWGMTEMSPLGTICRLASHYEGLDAEQRWDIKARQGRPIFGVDVRIVDDAGTPLPWDGVSMGELQVRGAAVIRQYYRRDPSQEHFTSDGWFRTGDVVTLSPNGYMRIADRTKDLVKSGGEWISTVELENTIMSHPGVLEAAVIAVPHPKWQERPLAVVVPKSETGPLTPADISDFLQDKVAKWWIPEDTLFVTEIPKTSVGKFDKKTLRERYAGGEKV